MKKHNKTTLIIGAIPYKNREESYGGTTVLLQNLIDYMASNQYPYKIIPTNRFNGKLLKKINFLYVIWKYVINLNNIDIVTFHVTSKGAFILFPILSPLALLFNKKIVFRKFAGSFKSVYKKQSPFTKAFFRFFLKKADLTFGETKELVSFFAEISGNPDKVLWFPNVRKKSKTIKISPYQKRLVFISHVKQSKGINEILEVSKRLPPDYTLDIYGPIKDESYTADYFKQYNVTYRGTINPDQVTNTLINYDILLLPTFHSGEGYPGIVIEAFSVGIPVIATNFGGIPEIVTDRYNGRLISPQNTDELEEAILSFHSKNYSNYSQNALLSFHENFDSDTVNKRITNKIIS